ncbi:alpha/beta fold hydrolase [Streptomyces sp. NPDC058611]|uniref:alpha/beta fold hydrolase n=1 Tax=unclassified Streptomyces TaxID=2593676 RepID=UPI00365C13A6
MTAPRQDSITDHFLAGDTPQRLALVRDPEAADALRGLLGAAAYNELAESAGPPAQSHLSNATPARLLFVPGLMGSALASSGLGGIWWLDIRNCKRIDSLALNPDGQNDTHPSFKIHPVAVDSSYEGFLFAAEMRSDIQHTAFPYDWRKPIQVPADRLYEVVVAENTNGYPKSPLNVVAHSMGGLIVRTALMRHPDMWQHIGKIVFIGTPHYGSPAIGGYLKNHLWGFDSLALLGKYLSRETFRSLSGVLNLLPAPAGVYPNTNATEGSDYDHPCVNFDPYDAAAWRLSIGPASELRLQSRLDSAAQLHRDLQEWHEGLDQRQRDRMAVIAGTGFKTLFRLAYDKRLGFLWQHMDRITSRIAHHSDRDGDGRVPLASAQLPWIGETRYVNGEHGSLPNLAAVQGDVWRFLTDKPMKLPSSPAAAMGQHLAASMPPISALVLPRLSQERSPDDPGYLDITGPTAAKLVLLKQQLESGHFPGFIYTRLL